MQLDRKYIICALIYAIFGMLLGIYMGAAQNHGQFVTHAHILLVGFVVSFVYGVLHKVWLVRPPVRLATIQFYLHHVSAIVMFIALFLLFGNFVPEDVAGPMLGLSSVAVLIGLLMMLYMVVRSSRPADTP